MNIQWDSIQYWSTHPDAIIYVVATALLYPVLIVEVLSLVYVAFEAGRFVWEVSLRHRRRDFAGMESAALEAREELRRGKSREAMERLAAVRAGMFYHRFFLALATLKDLSKVRVLKRLNDMELQVSKRLERTRMMIRLGPILGLMGTLIPISPALVALARGDVETLSSNLIVAFSTTVVGLLIGGLAYIVSVVRDRRYTQDISDIEYSLETLGL